MASEIEQAIKHICEEKGLSYEAVMETIETALAAAYRKDYGNKQQNIEVEFNTETGEMTACDIKEVVADITAEELEAMKQDQAAKAAAAAEEEIKGRKPGTKRRDEEEVVVEEGKKAAFNPKTQIMVSDAKVLKFGSQVGDVLRMDLPIPGEFGRMAAMTAKQVITQKLREAEREIVFNEYKEQEGEVLIGTVQRREGRVVLVDIGRTTGVILPADQVRSERYNSGDRVKVYVREVSLGPRGPQILLSRSSVELVRALFDLEVPEIAEETVFIKGISREAGSRTKIAVWTEDSSIDPIGACIGQRGIRIQTIINELGGEKIDVIEWSEDPETYIINSLSPAKVASVDMNEEDKTATVLVENDQLSLAIGRGGQNVRLAAQLSDWKLNVRDVANPEGANPQPKSEGDDAETTEGEEAKPEVAEGEVAPEATAAPEVTEDAAEKVEDAAPVAEAEEETPAEAPAEEVAVEEPTEVSEDKAEEAAEESAE
ncbi:transcription termination/antitermination protein NusA [Candidatus Uhrbacteria bacterium]|jgi:transcription termination/antitermination protein NusA|nr:transcription termination/antitermination protein NusA [Candidatus Uhrbacteria bacterium]